MTPRHMTDYPAWTDERVCEVERLWRLGHTSTHIAQLMSTTRNAVIGLINRRGWTRSEAINAANRLGGRPPAKWSSEHRAKLKELHALGLSGPKLQAALNASLGTTHTLGAVVWQRQSLGLAGNGAAPRVRREKAPPRAFSNPIQARVFGSPTAYRPESPDTAPRVKRPLVIDASCACRIEDLTDTRCKFPLGDPRSPTFVYCGRTKPADGSPYCASHHALSYKPPEAVKDAKALIRSLRRYVA